MISFQNVTFSYDGRSPVLNDVSFHIDEGRKVGLVGGNGAGKSTILSLIKGELVCDSGSVVVTGVVQAMSQIPPASLLTCTTPARNWLDEQASPGLLDFDQVHRILRSMQIPALTPLCQLSEGQRWKLHLCLSVLQPGIDILLLDEPSSHLDLPAALLLQQLLRASPSTVVIVSHDAALLDATATLIIALSPAPSSTSSTPDGSTAVTSSASYSDFLLERERAARRAEAAAGNATRKAAQLQAAARALYLSGAHGEKYIAPDKDKLQRDFFRDRSARSLHKSGVRARQRDKAEHRARASAEEARAASAAAQAQRVHFGRKTTKDAKDSSSTNHARPARPQHDLILDDAHCVELSDAELRYAGGGAALAPLSLCVAGGEHVALVGRNGAGKSLVLRALAGDAAVDVGGEGRRHAGRDVRMYLLGQEGISTDKSALQMMQEALPKEKGDELVKWIVSIGVPFEAVGVPMNELSPGQRARLAVLLLTLAAPNVLLLDEVTNFMDPGAREAIMEFLEGFVGTIICVTHDRELLQNLEWDRILEVDRDESGEAIILNEVDVDDWLEKGQTDAENVINLLMV